MLQYIKHYFPPTRFAYRIDEQSNLLPASQAGITVHEYSLI